ncbi:MAG TPA: GNAT family N-acetyltransferase, partial [Halococcus sp.]|nr:GNAT family N-acetyltransferase [Halococcus sp.]
MPGDVFLRGERVTLRTIERDDPDIDALRRSRNDPDLREGTSFRHPNNREQVEKFIEKIVEGDESSTNLFVCVDGDIVGAVELFDITPTHGTLGYWLLPEAWGQGYATEG